MSPVLDHFVTPYNTVYRLRIAVVPVQISLTRRARSVCTRDMRPMQSKLGAQRSTPIFSHNTQRYSSLFVVLVVSSLLNFVSIEYRMPLSHTTPHAILLCLVRE